MDFQVCGRKACDSQIWALVLNGFGEAVAREAQCVDKEDAAFSLGLDCLAEAIDAAGDVCGFMNRVKEECRAIHHALRHRALLILIVSCGHKSLHIFSGVLENFMNALIRRNRSNSVSVGVNRVG